MSRLLTAIPAAILGAVFGGCLGFVAAPAWEMAFVVVSPIAAITAAIAGALAASSRAGAWAAGASSLLAGIGMTLLAQSNPTWVVAQSAAVVLVAGVLSGIFGAALRRHARADDVHHLRIGAPNKSS